MPPISHQTIKLSRGRHSSPEHGACVMELASMLAGEWFSDHPRSVSRPIASFLRGYNDLLDDRRREDLYGYAARRWAPRVPRRSRTPARLGCSRGPISTGSAALRARCSTASGYAGVYKERSTDPEPAGTYAVHAIRKVNDETHAAALALVDELIAISETRSRAVARARARSSAVPARTSLRRRV